MHAVESELLKATAYKSRTKFANRQDYLGAILNAVMKLTNEDFDNLSDEAAAWANAAVEARNSRSDDLPDFDEVPDADASDDVQDEGESAEVESGDPEEASEGEDDAESEDEIDPDGNDEAVEDDDAPVDDEEVEAKPVKKAAKKPSKAVKPPKPDPKPGLQLHKMGRVKKPHHSDDDVILDRWGCMDGSKNSTALKMFEKGATSKEIKEALGGTYYNILKRQQMLGHLIEKEGAVIKLTHMEDIKAKAVKPAPKKGKK